MADEAQARRNPSMAAWMQYYGKAYGCPARPAFDPDSKYIRDNAAPSCWIGYQDGRRQYGGAQPDPNPSFNSDGSPRTPHKAPY
jgi:hypothetical protein